MVGALVEATPPAPSPMEPSGQSQINMTYIPTEDEKRVFRECNEESFWYRFQRKRSDTMPRKKNSIFDNKAVPIASISMVITQMLIKKGILTTHSRFGSIPKVAFAGFCGYIGGKLSYMKTCQEKFKKLENSPLGEALRKHRPMPHGYNSQQPGLSKVPPTFESAPAAESQTSSKYPIDNYGMVDFQSKYEPAPFSSSMNESSPTGISDSSPQEPIPSQEEGPKRRGFTYDELRNRNREMYEAGITQRSEVPSKSSQEIPLKKEGKVNKYGDSWEE